MRKLGVRVVSAALAACMMASVLPVGAFAADTEGAGEGTGISVTVPEDAQELPFGEVTAGGNYVLKNNGVNGRYYRTIIRTTADVTIYITEDVKYLSDEAILDVQQVGKLTIVNEGHTVDSTHLNATFMFVRSGATTQDITVTGGTYECGTATAFNINHSGNVNLKNVSVKSDNIAVTHNGTGTVEISGGTYGGNGNAALLNNGTGDMIIDADKVSGQKTAVINRFGSITIKGGEYTSQSSAAIVNGNNDGKESFIHGGTFECEGGDHVAIQNAGTLTIDGSTTLIKGDSAVRGAVINGGTLTFKDGTITASDGTGIMAVNSKLTTVAGGTIENCNSGLGMQSGDGKFIVKNVTLTGNNHDITLREKQQITFDDNYTGNPSIRVQEPDDATHKLDGRRLTNGAPTGLELKSHNYGYGVEEKSNEYYLKRNDLRKLEFTEDVTAKADDGNEETPTTDLANGDEVPIGTKVILDAIDHSDEDKEFDHWEILVDGTDKADELLENGKNSKDNSFFMPDGEVSVTPIYKDTTVTPPDDPEIPDTGDDGSGVAGAIVAGGAIIWGAYEAGTGIYRLVHMPGIILPSNRAELALLIWEKADKPAPESDELFADIDEDDTDLQQAARWMVEQDLMKEDEENNKFVPGAPVTKLQVCMTWQKAEDKGLID